MSSEETASGSAAAGMAEKEIEERLRAAVRDVPDFPKEGILFRDITTLLLDPDVHRLAVEALATPFRSAPPDRIMGIESRGFIFGSTLALELNAGFVLARKPGKLPHEIESASYDLEYGSDSIEVHKDAIRPGDRVLVFDDLIATGGTAAAACDLVERLGGEVAGVLFLIELTGLNGREKLGDRPVHSILRY